MFKLESDFMDYYDSTLTSVCNNGYYRRNRSDSMSRGEAFRFLRAYGLKTVDFGSINKVNRNSEHLVVYTNPLLHQSMGKKVCTYDEALRQYSNNPVAAYLKTSNGDTLKYLQVGERRFRLIFHNDEHDKFVLNEGKLIAFDEMPRSYNLVIRKPIYSIDYISDGIGMVVVDYNEVQSLKDIGFDSILDANTVTNEVIKAIEFYNKDHK